MYHDVVVGIFLLVWFGGCFDFVFAFSISSLMLEDVFNDQKL